MATVSRVVSISLMVEEDPDIASQVPFPIRTDEEIRKAVLAAIAVIMSDRPDVKVAWESMTTDELEYAPSVGRCRVCNCWVYDVEHVMDGTPTTITRGAVVAGKYFCDEHLPEDHPAAF